MIEPQMAQMGTDKISDGVHRDLSHSIIGAAMDVLNELRPGLDEKLYERALMLELKTKGHTVEQQRSFPVFYREQLIGTLVPDLIEDGLVVVDRKVVEFFNDSHVAQMLGYLAITRLNVALLLNFKFARLQTKRIVRD